MYRCTAFFLCAAIAIISVGISRSWADECSEQRLASAAETARIASELPDTHQGTTVLFLKTGETVRKIAIEEQTYSQALEIKMALTKDLSRTAELLPPHAYELQRSNFQFVSLQAHEPRIHIPETIAIDAIDVKWTPQIDRRALQIQAAACRDLSCQYPCVGTTGCTCAFGPCR